jgi:hypothetical protein
MKLRKLATLTAAAAAIAFGTPAMAANSVLFQGVTFQTSAVDADTMHFSILNATSATGDWTGIDHLVSFAFKDIGDITGATAAPNNLSFSSLELNPSGCDGGASGGACLTATPSPILLTDNMSWDITFTGTGLTFDAPHLKILFSGADVGDGHGSLYSQTIPAIPEPETYAMMLVGFSLLGFVARRRKQGLGNVVPA